MVTVAAFVIGAAATATAFAVMLVMMITSAFFGGGKRALQEGVDGLVGVASHAR